MKRRTFIGGLFASIGLVGTSLEVKGEKEPIISDKHQNFYEFFHQFNGFPINNIQKTMYRQHCYDTPHKFLGFGRQYGVSTFLLTLAAWESMWGKNVLHCSSNQRLCDMMREKFERKIGNTVHNTVDFVSMTRQTWPLHSMRYHVGLYDQSGNDYHYNWDLLYPNFEKGLHCRTVEPLENYV